MLFQGFLDYITTMSDQVSRAEHNRLFAALNETRKHLATLNNSLQRLTVNGIGADNSQSHSDSHDAKNVAIVDNSTDPVINMGAPEPKNTETSVDASHWFDVIIHNPWAAIAITLVFLGIGGVAIYYCRRCNKQRRDERHFRQLDRAVGRSTTVGRGSDHVRDLLEEYERQRGLRQVMPSPRGVYASPSVPSRSLLALEDHSAER